MARKKGRESDRAWLWILMNPNTFELRSSRKDKYPLHGLKLYKMVNGKFMGVSAIWEVGIVRTRDMLT
jgi:hypothetical protein